MNRRRLLLANSHVSENAELITFYMDMWDEIATFNAIQGMTWEQFMNSDFAKHEMFSSFNFLNGCLVIEHKLYGPLYVGIDVGFSVLASDIIISNYTYILH